jgi:hypothetical protein
MIRFAMLGKANTGSRFDGLGRLCYARGPEELPPMPSHIARRREGRRHRASTTAARL